MKIRASLPTVFAFLLVAGFAAAMPTASFDADEEVAPVVTPEETATPEPEETEEPEGTEDLKEEKGPETEERTENHGLAVSTAAKCGIKGRAHGDLVRSIAKDKSATVESATAACAAALAAQEAGTATVKSPKGPKLPKGADTTGQGRGKAGRPDHAGPKEKD